MASLKAAISRQPSAISQGKAAVSRQPSAVSQKQVPPSRFASRRNDKSKGAGAKKKSTKKRR
jgi:hypothetical protein